MPKSYLFINNPISGGKKNNFKAVFESQKHLFKNAKIVSTRHKKHAYELAAQYKNNFDVIVAVGGDGTINEVASALVNTNTTLGIIPLGSGNGFANHLGIPKNITKAIQRLLIGKFEIIDSILINNQTFVNVAGIGFDGHITQLFNKTKLRGLWSYARLVIIEFLKFKEFEYSVVANNQTFTARAFIIAIANSSQYGNNFRIAPKAKTNDGLFNVMIFKKPSFFASPYIIWQIFRGKAVSNSHCKEIVTNHLTLTQPSQPIHLDGEDTKFETTALDIQVVQESLQVII